jgi:hypothetical protein
MSILPWGPRATLAAWLAGGLIVVLAVVVVLHIVRTRRGRPAPPDR